MNDDRNQVPSVDRVVASRALGSANIRLLVTDAGYSVGMPLDEFLANVVEEIGSPAFLLTQQQLQQRIAAAKDAVILKLKGETIQLFSH